MKLGLPIINVSIPIKSSNTILYCQQWQATVDFYRHVLELPVTFTSDWFVEFRISGAAHLSIADEQRATIKSSGGAGITITLQVDDIEAVHAALYDKGASVGPIQDHTWGARVFYFFDPEGHRLEVWSPTPQSTPAKG